MAIRLDGMGVAAAFLVLSAVSTAGQSAGPVRAEADRTQPPADAVAVVTVWAKGVQIYHCEQGQSGAAAWVFLAPEAALYAAPGPDGEVLGTHGAGPVWRWKDGSAVAGKVLEKKTPAEAGAIPWLLLSAVAAPGSSGAGQLVGVIYVRRAETHGGAEPGSGCDAAHLHVEARVPYTAAYTFYRGVTR